PEPGGRQLLKPTRRWLLSQNGLLLLCPQRHRRAVCTRATTRPVPLMISRLPRTLYGPSRSGSIARSPSRVSSMSVLLLGGSPVASKPISLCDWSQNGLFFEAPQRHSVAR